MKPYPFIPIMLVAAALFTSGCGNTRNQLEETTGQTAEQTADQTAETNTGEDTTPEQSQNRKKPSDKAELRTWAEQKSSKYSDTGELIYNLYVCEPEVIIPENMQVQCRLNRYIREKDMVNYYNFITDSMDSYSEARKNGETWPGNYFTFDYSVLKNDGRILSLRQDFETYTGGAHGEHSSYLNSYDTKTGQRITLDSLSDNPEGLKLALRQVITEQVKSTTGDDSIAQNVMSADIQNFAFLSDGIHVLYNLYELGGSYAFGIQDYLVPYETLENQLNDYGKQLAGHASEYEDEPEITEPIPDYIFPQSSTACLTGEDLLEADDYTLRLARNEIYARHGRTFEASDLTDYFNQKTWYHAEVDPSAFDENVFNEIEKKNLDLIRTAEDQIKSREITDSGVTLEPDREYELDLDGDGVCESISWKAKTTQDWAYSQIELYVNGEKQSCIPENLRGGFNLSALDLQKGDGEIELHLNASEDSDILVTFSFYRYQKGKLEPIADLAGEVSNGHGYLSREGGFRADGDGLLAVLADTPFYKTTQRFGCYYVDLLFSYKNGKIEEIPQEIYPKKDYEIVTSAFNHDNEWKYYVVSSEYTAMTEIEGNITAFQAKPGETVCPVAWTTRGDTSYVLIMNEAGDCGWAKELPWDIQPEVVYYEFIPAWG